MVGVPQDFMIVTPKARVAHRLGYTRRCVLLDKPKWSDRNSQVTLPAESSEPPGGRDLVSSDLPGRKFLTRLEMLAIKPAASRRVANAMPTDDATTPTTVRKTTARPGAINQPVAPPASHI